MSQPDTTEAAAYLRTLRPWDFRQEQWEVTARCLCAAADEIERLRVELKAVGEEAERLARQYQALSGIIEAMKEKGL